MIDISVIVTAYNLEKYMRSCLDSILNQCGVSFEVICVDDASTDGTAAILEGYKERDGRIKVIRHSSNKGLASARNEGYRHAKGEYLYNIDGDDLLVEDALQQMYHCAKQNNLDLLGFSGKCFFDDECMRQFGSENEYVRKHKYDGLYTGPELFAALIRNGDRASSNRVLYCYKRSFFLENDLYDEEGLRYADDSMFSYYVTAKRAMCVPNLWYLRRYRYGSAVTSPLKKRYLESMIVLFCTEINRWRSLELTDEVNQQISVYFDLRLQEIYQLHRMFMGEKSKESYLEGHPADGYFYKRFIKNEPLHLNSLTTAQMERIRRASAVILYGAGYTAMEVAKVLEYYSIVDYQVAVTARKADREIFRGKQIKSIQDFKGMDDALIVAAMDKKHEKDVMPVLERYGFQNIIWVSL